MAAQRLDRCALNERRGDATPQGAFRLGLSDPKVGLWVSAGQSWLLGGNADSGSVFLEKGPDEISLAIEENGPGSFRHRALVFLGLEVQAELRA